MTIDCPSDCPYLIDARKHEFERRQIDWSSVPFADVQIPSAFVMDNAPLIMALGHAVLIYALSSRLLADPDAVASLQSLAETYRTLSKGVYYEKPPDYAIQRGLYDALKTAIENFKQTEAKRTGMTTVRDSAIRDALIFTTQMAATRSNGRPKSRAYIDFLRDQFKSEEAQKPSASTLVLP